MCPNADDNHLNMRDLDQLGNLRWRASLMAWTDAIDESSDHADVGELNKLLDKLLAMESAFTEDARESSAGDVYRKWLRSRELVRRTKGALLEIGAAESLILLPDEKAIAIDVVAISHGVVAKIADDPTVLFELGPRKFEELIAELLSDLGWAIEITAATRDGGYDIFGIVNNLGGSKVATSYLVECKRYRADRKVGISIARELLHVKSETTTANALIATTSDFTSGVYALQDKRYDLDLKNGSGVLEWCRFYRKNRQ